MSTIYMSQLSTLPLMEGDQDQGHFPAFHLAKDPPILFPFMIDNPVEHQGQSYGDQHLRQQVLGESNHQFNDHMMMGGSDVFPPPAPFRPTIQSIGSDMIQRSSYDPYDVENKRGNGSTSKWTSATPPAKMRIVRKATNDPEGGAARKPRRRAQAYQADESQQQQQQQQAMGVIRVCLDCNTTKTPLWRSGPCGPKSLCNACGIRQRKARRAMAAAAAAAANGGAAAAGTPVSEAQAKPEKKEKRADVDRSLPFKKRCKIVDHAAAAAAAAAPATAAKAAVGVAAPTKDHDHAGQNVAATSSLSKAGPPPAFFHGFPSDEITDAAMLLMTLSCGLVRS